jgi:ATP/maltotriose-dependent transcriptional regulator MalT
VPYGALLLAAWRGDEPETARLIEITTAEVLRRGEGVGLVATAWARALLYNSLGRYPEALAAADEADELQQEAGLPTWAVQVELIEAAARTRAPDRAVRALHQLTDTARTSGTEWGLGVAARSRGLLTDDAAAEDAYREAIDRLSHTGIRGELARAHLVYGEWLRRRRHRVEARRHLRTAHEMFTDMDMQAFAERAARELRATGAIARKRTTGTPNLLTAQETQIARLVRGGLSNTEIADRLFISPRTVEWHMRRIFKKLGITSRKQLDR